ncbi:MAG TPA: hypothetical protein PKL83_03325 [bacterium]|nr:hypothetical protein [bacterium]
MKQVLGCFGIIIVVFIVGLLLFEKAVVKEPEPLRQETPGVFDSYDATLETYIWARNEEDYATYRECLGLSGDFEETAEIESEMSLWGEITEYEIQKVRQYGELVIVQVVQDYRAPNGNRFTGQRADYYFQKRLGRWVYLPDGIERSIVWLKSIVWSIWEK